MFRNTDSCKKKSFGVKELSNDQFNQWNYYNVSLGLSNQCSEASMFSKLHLTHFLRTHYALVQCINNFAAVWTNFQVESLSKRRNWVFDRLQEPIFSGFTHPMKPCRRRVHSGPTRTHRDPPADPPTLPDLSR